MFPLWQLQVLTPSESTLDVGGVRWVRLELSDGGRISIWPGHGPLLAETGGGPVRYQDGAGEHSVMVSPGILRVSPGRVCIFTSVASPAGGVQREDLTSEGAGGPAALSVAGLQTGGEQVMGRGR
jgi:F0F1-type ATP synthase epsilon subunit